MGLVTRFNQCSRNYYKVLRTRPAEALAFAFLLIASLIVYTHGAFYLLPMIASEQSQFVQVIAFVSATWCLLAVWAHLYYLHLKNSSIMGKILEQPVVIAAPESGDSVTVANGRNQHYADDSSEGKDLRERQIVEQTKAIGQQFLVTPFGSETAWHICATCETYVPPRAWHCERCSTCIMRRDHHCLFTMCCIGEDNQIHFLGMLLYLTIGTSYATYLSMSYSFHYLGIPIWKYIAKALVSAYTILFDFSVVGVLSSLTFVGGLSAGGVFTYYMYLAAQGKTSSDQSRRIERVPENQKFTYQTLRTFLGPNLVLRMLWPFASSQESESSKFIRNEEEDVKTV